MKNIFLLLLTIMIYCVSCSKSGEEPTVEEESTKEKSSTLSAQEQEYKKTLIGTWVLDRQSTDDGGSPDEPRYVKLYYRRTLTFKEDFSYTDSISYFDDKYDDEVHTFKYNIEVKAPNGSGYNPYIIVYRASDKVSGVFNTDNANELFIFNGVGGEHYKKVK